MEPEYISIEIFTRSHGINPALVDSLAEYGMITICSGNEGPCIEISKLPEIERMIRLHNELQVNLEGIDIIMNLLRQMDQMHTKMNALRNRLMLYENRPDL